MGVGAPYGPCARRGDMKGKQCQTRSPRASVLTEPRLAWRRSPCSECERGARAGDRVALVVALSHGVGQQTPGSPRSPASPLLWCWKHFVLSRGAAGLGRKSEAKWVSEICSLARLPWRLCQGWSETDLACVERTGGGPGGEGRGQPLFSPAGSGERRCHWASQRPGPGGPPTLSLLPAHTTPFGSCA